MNKQDVECRHVLLYYFLKGKNASQAHKKLRDTYGNDALNERQCQNWFAKFRSGNFSLKDARRSGRPVEVHESHIKAIIDSDPYITTREIAEKLNVSHTCIQKKLKRLGHAKKLDLSVRHQLKEFHLVQRISICDSLLKRKKIDPFLKRLITGAEKWIVYTAQATSEAEIRQEMIMLSVWWDYKGILYFELLPRNQTVNSNEYVQQLVKLSNAVQKMRPELANCKDVIFQHDNANFYTSSVTSKLLELGWERLPHPPNSSDLVPSEYHLFHSVQNSLNSTIFNDAKDVKSHLIQFFAGKDQKFYEDGIMTLPERWQKVIDKDGQYLIE